MQIQIDPFTITWLSRKSTSSATTTALPQRWDWVPEIDLVVTSRNAEWDTYIDNLTWLKYYTPSWIGVTIWRELMSSTPVTP